MKIVIDENIPYGEQAFSTLGDVYKIPGREINPSIVSDAGALIVRSVTDVNEKLLTGSNVKFVGTATIGTDHIDREFLNDNGIFFVSAPGSNSNSVAEYIICSLIVLSKEHEFSLEEKTLGIVGVGNIGSKVKKKARALGMKTILNDPPLYDKTGDDKYRSIEELKDKSDIITFHVPLTINTKYPTYHMVDRKFLSEIRENAVIINSSRGSVVDTDSLKESIRLGDVSNVILDVWENEPDIDLQLLEMSFLGTPHIAGYSLDGKVNGTNMIYRELCKFMGEKIQWKPEVSLPEVKNPKIELKNNSNRVKMLDIVSKIYDIREDDRELRKLLNEDINKKGEFFDDLRKNYPERREFYNTEIIIGIDRKEMGKKLEGIGFRVVFS